VRRDWQMFEVIEAARKSSWAQIAEALDLSSVLGVLLVILLGSSRALGRGTDSKVGHRGAPTGNTSAFWIHESVYFNIISED
jgi:hypothetical protein